MVIIEVFTGSDIKTHPNRVGLFEIEDGFLLHPNDIAAKVDTLDFTKNQVIWTNSDHVINRLLVNLKLLNMSFDLLISFHHNGEHQFIVPSSDGRLRYTPKGFFDQLTIDRKILMGF